MEINCKLTLGQITTNCDAIKITLKEELEKYKNLVITESEVTTGKSTRSKLNSLRKAIDAERIRIKKEYQQPLEQFELSMKELTSMIEEVVSGIDKQIKNFDEIEKNKKIEEIKDYWNSKNFTLITLEKIYNSKWENKTFKMGDIEEEIDTTIDYIKSDLQTIELLQPEESSFIKIKYLDSLSLSVATQAWKDEQAKKRALEEYTKIQEEKKAEIQKQLQQQQNTHIETEAEIKEVKPLSQIEEENLPKIYTITLLLKGTSDQLKQLSNFIKSNNISYQKI